jgi:hypothetical protein
MATRLRDARQDSGPLQPICNIVFCRNGSKYDLATDGLRNYLRLFALVFLLSQRGIPIGL